MLIIKVVNFIYIPVKITYNITRLAKRRRRKRRGGGWRGIRFIEYLALNHM
jgi:hypothetical protein